MDDENYELASDYSGFFSGPVPCQRPRFSMSESFTESGSCPRESGPVRIHRAVWDEDFQRVEKLVFKRGISLECLNEFGQTPLFVATYTRNVNMTKFLLQLGADPNGVCAGGYTPVHGACFSGSKKILSYIIQAGGDIETLDCWRQSPIDWVYEQSDPDKQNKVLEIIESVRKWTLTTAVVDCTSSPKSNKSSTNDLRYNNNNNNKHRNNLNKPVRLAKSAERPGGQKLNYDELLYGQEVRTLKETNNNNNDENVFNRHQVQRRASIGSAVRNNYKNSQASSDGPSYPTRYRLRCSMVEDNRAKPAEVSKKSPTNNNNKDDMNFVDSAEDYDRRRHSKWNKTREIPQTLGKDNSFEENRKLFRERRSQFLNQSFSSMRELHSMREKSTTSNHYNSNNTNRLKYNERPLYRAEKDEQQQRPEFASTENFHEKYRKLQQRLETRYRPLVPSQNFQFNVISNNNNKSSNNHAISKSNPTIRPSPTKSSIPPPMTKPVLLPERNYSNNCKQKENRRSPGVDRRSIFLNQKLFVPPKEDNKAKLQQGGGDNAVAGLIFGSDFAGKFTFAGPNLATSTPNEVRTKGRSHFNFPAPQKKPQRQMRPPPLILQESFNSVTQNDSQSEILDSELYITAECETTLETEKINSQWGFNNNNNNLNNEASTFNGAATAKEEEEGGNAGDVWNTAIEEENKTVIDNNSSEYDTAVAVTITDTNNTLTNDEVNGWGDEEVEEQGTIRDNVNGSYMAEGNNEVEWGSQEEDAYETVDDIEEVTANDESLVTGGGGDGWNSVDENDDDDNVVNNEPGDQVDSGNNSNNPGEVEEPNGQWGDAGTGGDDWNEAEEEEQETVRDSGNNFTEEVEEEEATIPNGEQGYEWSNDDQQKEEEEQATIPEEETLATIPSEVEWTVQEENSNKDWNENHEEEIEISNVPHQEEDEEAWATAENVNTTSEANNNEAAWTTATEEEEQEQKTTTKKKVSEWSLKSQVDFYCDDDALNGGPNTQLHSIEDEDELGDLEHHRGRYPPHPMLHDQESILSMDIPSTGPTSLRSNFTDDEGKDEYLVNEDSNSRAERFATLTSSDALAEATLIYSK